MDQSVYEICKNMEYSTKENRVLIEIIVSCAFSLFRLYLDSSMEIKSWNSGLIEYSFSAYIMKGNLNEEAMTKK